MPDQDLEFFQCSGVNFLKISRNDVVCPGPLSIKMLRTLVLTEVAREQLDAAARSSTALSARNADPVLSIRRSLDLKEVPRIRPVG
jgi:hypothetical protein